MEKNEIVEHYWNYLLKKGKRPKSVYAFASKLGMEEAAFYEHFSSLGVIERGYWESTVVDTIAAVESDDEFSEYPVDEKLLAFFFTYITHIQKHRSRFAHYFPKMTMCEEKALSGMKHAFRNFMKQIVASGVEEGAFADRKKLTESYDKFLWMQMLAVIRFYLHDESDGFQDTDAFIEKSLKVAVQSAASGVLESGLDLLRFMAGKDDRLKKMAKMMSKFIPNS